jgi:hypothetical protein
VVLDPLQVGWLWLVLVPPVLVLVLMLLEGGWGLGG